MKKYLLFLIILSLIISFSFAQNQKSLPTSPNDRFRAWEYQSRLKEISPFRNLLWKCVGPTFVGGRISGIAVHPDKPYTIFVAVGSGGVWKSENNGTTWEPIFDSQPTFAIGAIAIAPSNPDIIWVGTGEELMARSSYAGVGIFKSTDGGKTWKNMGLHDSHHISKILIDPVDPDIVYVAVLGHEYTFNEERGLFKTTDGGKSWQKILYISPKTGVVDVAMDPFDRNILYASAWERDRKAWNNVESGEESGIYKSIDGGKTWKKLTNGFPVGKHVGRIGLAVAPSNPNVVYAFLDNQASRAGLSEEKRIEVGLNISKIEKMTKEEFLKIDLKVLTSFLREMGVPPLYTAETILEMIKKGELTPKSFAEYLLNLYLDRKLHETNIIGAEVYRSDDKGESWRKVNTQDLQFMFHTYGYSFCDIRVSPDNENKIYILGIRLLKSEDGGKTFKDISEGVHVDHHDLWIDPKNPDRLIDGNDGGLYFSYDGGKTWKHINNIPIAEFYAISVDNDNPYNIYGGTQDNGTLYGPSTSLVDPLRWDFTDRWKSIAGGDGFFVFKDPYDSNTVYFEYQFGKLIRKSLKDGTEKDIMPVAKIGEPPLRYNWMTPFIISCHNPFILYYGANKLFKSLNRGDSWICISPDLTNPSPEKQGDVPYSTITTIAESPLRPGLIYVGTDDGNVWVTMNEGVTWKKINKGLPSKWVSRIVASKYEEGTVFLAMTGYREDDFSSYLFMSMNYGENWQSISSNLPAESINVIREDPHYKNILYVGTDLGIYVSLDRGKTWHSLRSNLPTCAVHDIVVHPIEDDLIIGTHGRSAWIMKDLEIIKKLEDIKDRDIFIFDIKPVRLSEVREERKVSIYYYLKKVPMKLKVIVMDEEERSKELVAPKEEGINRVEWDLSFDRGERRVIRPGKYKVEVTADDKKAYLTFSVER